mmetsp:Transcript_112922/g.315490  ORF Transcript_112922/g.315490 Transcript_112922/m.315490 type:complete len:244 (+) Transcript_112922:1325-2056(+)
MGHGDVRPLRQLLRGDWPAPPDKGGASGALATEFVQGTLQLHDFRRSRVGLLRLVLQIEVEGVDGAAQRRGLVPLHFELLAELLRLVLQLRVHGVDRIAHRSGILLLRFKFLAELMLQRGDIVSQGRELPLLRHAASPATPVIVGMLRAAVEHLHLVVWQGRGERGRADVAGGARPVRHAHRPILESVAPHATSADSATNEECDYDKADVPVARQMRQPAAGKHDLAGAAARFRVLGGGGEHR